LTRGVLDRGDLQDGASLRWLGGPTDAGRSVDNGFFPYPYLVEDPLLESVRGEADYQTSVELAHTRHESFKKKFF
jgi:hypothetical protein